MLRYPLLVLSFTLLALTPARSASIEEDMKIVADHLRDSLQQIKSTVSADDFIKKQNPDGSWADIPYDSNIRSPWQPLNHIERLLAISKAGAAMNWKMPESQPYLTSLTSGLKFWYDKKPVSLNWWYQTIGVPMSLAPAAILSWDQLPETLKPSIVENLTNAGAKQETYTGTNRAWIASNNLTLALLTHNESLLLSSLKALTEELRVTPQEGLQPDWSFHQHGAMLQTGNYGNAFLGTQINLAKLLAGTRWEIPIEKIRLLTSYVLEHNSWPIWGKYYDISACGRQMDHTDSLALKARGAARAARSLADIDSQNAAPLRSIYERWEKGTNEGGPIGARYWWRSEYFILRQPEWMISLKLCSSRTLRVETVVNDENKIALFMNDGATWIRVRGDEQNDLQPLLDWRRIPGVTGRDINDPVPPKTGEKQSPSNGGNSWVGGCTAGNRGVVAMNYKNDSLTAKKSWFFFPWGMVCLGADVKEENGTPLFTGVNQAFLKKTALLWDGAEKDATADFTGEAGGVWHDNVAYWFSPKQRIRLFQGKRSGLWTDLKTLGSPKEPAVGDVFQLNIVQEKNPSYEYAVIPGTPKENFKSVMQKPSWKILSNESNVQAVEEINGSTCGIVFWKPGSVQTALGTVTVDQACVLLVEGDGKTRQITAADPNHSLSSVQVSITGSWKGEGATISGGNTSLKIALPAEGMAGSSITAKLSN